MGIGSCLCMFLCLYVCHLDIHMTRCVLSDEAGRGGEVGRSHAGFFAAFFHRGLVLPFINRVAWGGRVIQHERPAVCLFFVHNRPQCCFRHASPTCIHVWAAVTFFPMHVNMHITYVRAVKGRVAPPWLSDACVGFKASLSRCARGLREHE